MSNSYRHHGLQPTRLLHPWDVPGKSRWVCCHCLLRVYSLASSKCLGWNFPEKCFKQRGYACHPCWLGFRYNAWSSSSHTRPQFSSGSVQSLSCVRLFATPWIATCQASLSITNSQSSLKLMSIELVMSSNHLILCHPLLLLPSIFLSIRVFSNESVLYIRWPKYLSIVLIL